MCTAISLNSGKHLFGRTLDLEFSYGENVVITPENFAFHLRHQIPVVHHPALVGTAHIADGFPLYYDAMNSSGLCAAALNFPGYAVYQDPKPMKVNLAAFEVIPYILSACQTLEEARNLLGKINVTREQFSEKLPSTPLHWIFADASGAIVAEPLTNGLRIFENPFGVLTNSPPFDYHTTHLADFLSLNSAPPKNTLFPSADLRPYSRGMGAIGLPGDLSSASRFVRAAFVKAHTNLIDSGDEISRFFHVIGAVAQPNGCALTDDGKPIRTIYSSCIDTTEQIYYFTTYGCRRIRAVRINNETASFAKLSIFPMIDKEDISYLN